MVLASASDSWYAKTFAHPPVVIFPLTNIKNISKLIYSSIFATSMVVLFIGAIVINFGLHGLAADSGSDSSSLADSGSESYSIRWVNFGSDTLQALPIIAFSFV